MFLVSTNILEDLSLVIYDFGSKFADMRLYEVRVEKSQ